ncbi:MAG: ferritin family protein [Thermodesulfobacteriota bacterium]
MMYDFNAKDVFEMALQLERNGALFYKKAAENVKDASFKSLLLDLSGMEVGHEKVFASMMADLKDKEKEQTIFDPQEESLSYLRALADTRVFFEKKIDLSSLKEIFMSAIGAEKDSIVFYLGMKDLVPEKFGKNRLDAIIREEMGHIEVLSRHLISVAR